MHIDGWIGPETDALDASGDTTAVIGKLLGTSLGCTLALLAGSLVSAGQFTRAKGDLHKASVIGATVGDPLKDTSGPSLNILIKLMAVESLMFAPFFAAHGGLFLKLL
ncbi:hypothetical protein B296_00051005 [Ensete ventricosum]|uniref:H(+)-exporting diphosphatase n=1 Tax=Ensete ventricosum TaxID=4639 RepID=A0A426YAC0_ENSVE|nr:hypothetical protein B296_00051005 [Ensete ventricosum]